MFIIKDEVIINSENVERIQKLGETMEPYSLLFSFVKSKEMVIDFPSKYDRDLAFLSILQSISQGLTTCYLDSDISKYQVSTSPILTPKKKRGLKC